MWRAKWNLHPRGPSWLPEIIRLTWYLQVISVVIGLHSGIDGTLFQPFFWARTSCCGESGTPRELPAKYDSHYPDTWLNCAPCIHIARGLSAAHSLFGRRICLHHASRTVDLDPASASCDPDYAVTELADGMNVTKIKACDVPELPHHAPYWSHSPYCPNWDYVKDFTQSLSSKRNTYLTLAGAVFMPIGAGFADKQGRKPILFFNFLMGMKSLFINLLSSTSTQLSLAKHYYLVSGVSVSPFGSAYASSSCAACIGHFVIVSDQVISYLSALTSHHLCHLWCPAAVPKRSVADSY